MSRSWDELQRLKDEALNNDQMVHATFWQNEQLMLKLNAISWYLKKLEERNV
jgi:hypothetical protein